MIILATSWDRPLERCGTGKKSPQNYFFWQGRDRPKFDMAIWRSLNYN
ncbi:hypothetical protein QUA81_10510 [Microcoleus sp. F6_B4]